MKPKYKYHSNKLIAEFMGIEFTDNDKCNHPLLSSPFIPIECLMYHSNWNWLMPVIEKIEDIKDCSNGFGFSFKIDNWSVEIKNLGNGDIPISLNPANTAIKSKIEACFIAIVEFIKLYKSDYSNKA